MKVTVYVATMCRIDGLRRTSFSQTINHIYEQHPYYNISQGDFKCGDLAGNHPPANHILIKWLDYLVKEGFWNDWMLAATDVSLYHLDYIDKESLDAEAKSTS